MYEERERERTIGAMSGECYGSYFGAGVCSAAAMTMCLGLNMHTLARLCGFFGAGVFEFQFKFECNACNTMLCCNFLFIYRKPVNLYHFMIENTGLHLKILQNL